MNTSHFYQSNSNYGYINFAPKEPNNILFFTRIYPLNYTPRGIYWPQIKIIS